MSCAAGLARDAGQIWEATASLLGFSLLARLGVVWPSGGVGADDPALLRQALSELAA